MQSCSCRTKVLIRSLITIKKGWLLPALFNGGSDWGITRPRASCRSQDFSRLILRQEKLFPIVIRKSSQRICSPLRGLSFASLTFVSNLLKNEFVKYRNCTRPRASCKSPFSLNSLRSLSSKTASCRTKVLIRSLFTIKKSWLLPALFNGGARGIRTPDIAFQPYIGLANRRLQPLGHRSIMFSIFLFSQKNLVYLSKLKSLFSLSRKDDYRLGAVRRYRSFARNF